MFAEIEAKEACDWLRAAGFPQYVQLFKGKHEAGDPGRTNPHHVSAHSVLSLADCRFPIDIERATRDHHFLDRDALDSMCRCLTETTCFFIYAAAAS